MAPFTADSTISRAGGLGLHGWGIHHDTAAEFDTGGGRNHRAPSEVMPPVKYDSRPQEAPIPMMTPEDYQWN